MSAAGQRQRLFFALWPDDAVREALAELARTRLARGDGRLVAPENLHLTLAFLGSVDEAFCTCAQRAADRVTVPAFKMELVRAGRWSRASVLWTAPEETPEALSRLSSALNGALRECGYTPDTRPLRAHVTLARKVKGSYREVAHAPVLWPVAAFHLVASQTHPRGARYQRVRSWPLG